MSENTRPAENSKGKIALVFPGQGSQSVGMGKALYENFAEAREVFAEADDSLGFKISDLCFAGSEAELQLTANTQPAILTVSVAAYRVFIKHWDGLPSAAAGHSLGEYSAIVAANGMKFADAVRIVRKRGLYMQEAVPVGTGAMAAIIGLDTKSIEEACIEARTLGECAPANYNSPKQVVIAGTTNAVEKAMELAKSKGAKRAIKLNVSAPFHCSLMQPAAEKLAEELREIEYFEPDFPIVHNFDALFNDSGKEISGMLKRQVASPVLWQQSVENMAGRGIDTFIEIGPGKVLSGLIKQIYPEAKTFNIADTESLNETINSL